MAYEKAAERLKTWCGRQNPAAPASEKSGFEHLFSSLPLRHDANGAGTLK